jgi:hypothetical protein
MIAICSMDFLPLFSQVCSVAADAFGNTPFGWYAVVGLSDLASGPCIIAAGELHDVTVFLIHIRLGLCTYHV